MHLGRAIRLAVGTLKGVLLKGESERASFYKCLREFPGIDSQTTRFGYLLGYETLRRLNFVDSLIAEVSEKSIEKINTDTLNFLRIFVFWSKFREKEVEKHIRFLSEGKNFLTEKDYKIANEISLKLYSLNSENFLFELEDIERLSLKKFHSEWFTEYCIRLFGKKFTLELFDAYNRQKPTYIRVNTLKMGAQDVIEALKRESVKVTPVNGVQYVYRLTRTRWPLVKLKSYRKGLFTAQDKSSCLVATTLNPMPGEVVLDICAAPGGKTSLIAQLMNNKGKIYSVDNSSDRMKVWENEMRRLEVLIAEPIIGDAKTKPIRIKVDRILVDPPCTGTGTFNTFPSMKWRINPYTVKTYSTLQYTILDNCASLIKKDGVLVYSTCSITIEENEKVIEMFLLHHPNFELIEACPGMGSPTFMEHPGPKRFYPNIDGSYGFFVAKLKRSD